MNENPTRARYGGYGPRLDLRTSKKPRSGRSTCHSNVLTFEPFSMAYCFWFRAPCPSPGRPFDLHFNKSTQTFLTTIQFVIFIFWSRNGFGSFPDRSRQVRKSLVARRFQSSDDCPFVNTWEYYTNWRQYRSGSLDSILIFDCCVRDGTPVKYLFEFPIDTLLIPIVHFTHRSSSDTCDKNNFRFWIKITSFCNRTVNRLTKTSNILFHYWFYI